ncbi:hypothetical protein [Oleiharenicola sp. Vm1]|uniref:hypothetical protein n=1 Tax=Oleiharenicola sp. Vm1 TaxID=3398393 RepID=UPI0039F578C1
MRSELQGLADGGPPERGRTPSEALAYFKYWTFGRPANFRAELTHLFSENYGVAMERRARAALTPTARWDFRGKLVSLLAECWGVNPVAVSKVFKSLPVQDRRKLDAIVDEVVKEEIGETAFVAMCESTAKRHTNVSERRLRAFDRRWRDRHGIGIDAPDSKAHY